MRAQALLWFTVAIPLFFSIAGLAIDGGVLLDAGGGNFAIHADAYGRKASDYSIPSYPYLFDPTKPFNGKQPNSAMQADGASIGGSYIFQGGFIGAAITQNDTLYRIPGIDGADHQTRIDAHQTKFTAKGEYRPDAAAIDAVRFWTGATDYKHNEIGLADPADPTTLSVRQTFTNKEQEGRIEVQLAPFNARFAALTTAFGLQAGHQDLTAPITRPASMRTRPSFRPRASTGRTRLRSTPSGSGRLPPTTSTTKSASPIRPTSRH